MTVFRSVCLGPRIDSSTALLDLVELLPVGGHDELKTDALWSTWVGVALGTSVAPGLLGVYDIVGMEEGGAVTGYAELL